MTDEPLPPSLPAPPAETVFPVEYDEFGGRSFPRDARGQGTLAIQGVGADATYVFTGPAAPSLSLGSELALAYDAAKLKNVWVDGTRIEFVGTLRSGLAPAQGFAFHARTPAEATAIARLFPTTRDAEFTADQEFYERFDRLPAARSPWTSVTGLIILANAAIFVAMGLAGAGWLSEADPAPYLRYGANYAPLTTDSQWWRLVSSAFLHYGIIHLAVNMWGLFQAGLLLEKLLGHALFTVVYFGSGIAGSLTTLWWHGANGGVSAGASGAVFGVVGALVGYMLHEQHALPRTVWQPLTKSLLTVTFYNLVFGQIVTSIDNAAHVGGLVGGFALGWLVALPLDLGERQRLLVRRLGTGLAAIGVAIAVGVAVAPRFDYRVADEVAWDAAYREPNNRDRQLLTTLGAALRRHREGRPNPELARLLAEQIIPANETWIRDLSALPLAPGRRTAHRRDLAVAGLQLRLKAYQNLLAAVQRSAPDSVRVFNHELMPAYTLQAQANALRVR